MDDRRFRGGRSGRGLTTPTTVHGDQQILKSSNTTGPNGEKFGLGFSGSVAFNRIEQNTKAFIKDKVDVNVTGDLDLEAFSSPTLIAGAGGFAFGNDWASAGPMHRTG